MTTVRSTLIQGKYNHIAALEIKNKNARCISVHSYETVTKANIETLHIVFFSGRTPTSYLSTVEYSKFNSIFIDVIVLSLRPVPKNRIESVLKYADVIKPSKCYYEEINEKHRISKSYKNTNVNIREVEMKTRIHFLSNIKSDIHLKDELDELLNTYLMM